VLHAIWRARCDLFHGELPSLEAARERAYNNSRNRLRTLVYMKTTSPIRPVLPGLSMKQTFFQQQAWNLFRPTLMEARHQQEQQDPARCGPSPSRAARPSSIVITTARIARFILYS